MWTAGCGWEEWQVIDKRKSVLAAVVNRFHLAAASNKSSHALCAHCFSILACNSTYLKEHLVVQCCAPDLNKSSTTMKSTTAISLLKALNKILHWHARH